jgi:hypothetical protein
MRNVHAGLLVGCVVVLVLAWARPRAAHRPLPAGAVAIVHSTGFDFGETGHTISLDTKLSRILPKVEFNNASLDEVAQRFRDWTGENVVIDWESFAPPQPRGATFNASLTDIRASDALLAVLASSGQREFGYGYCSGVLMIGASSDYRVGGMELRVYDVRDLLRDARGIEGKPADARGAATADIDRLAQLAELIRATLDWDDTRVQCWPGRLLVRATPRNHRFVEKLLAGLRRGTERAR